MNVYIKNEDSIDRTIRGKVIASGSYYLIPPREVIDWANDSAVLTLVGNSTLVVAQTNDELNDFDDVASGINYLKGLDGGIVRLNTEDTAGTPKVVTTKPTGNFDTVITTNFCDNTTWTGGPTDSAWEMIPGEGKILNVDRAEAQFEHDLQISPNEIYLDYHAWVAPATTMMVQRITFSRVQDLFALGNSHYHAPALVEAPSGLSTILFDYANKLRFYGSENLGQLYKLVISTSNDAEITGSYATIGFVTEETDQ